MSALISRKYIFIILGITFSMCALVACVQEPMTENNVVQEDSGFGSGASSGGEALTNSAGNIDSSQNVESTNEGVREVPLGTPGSPEEFQNLKQSAEQLSVDEESTSDIDTSGADNEGVREVPLGTPGSPEEFQNLKQSAEQLSVDEESTSDADM